MRVKITTVDALPQNGVRSFDCEGERIALYNVGGQIYATDAICTHSYYDLGEGFVDPDDCSIECPLHGARFRIDTGAVLALPAYGPLATYPVAIEGDEVFVDLP